MRRVCVLIWLVAVVGSAQAQGIIDPGHRSAWSENGGWVNWAPEGSDPGDPVVGRGLSVATNVDGSAFLSGFLWWENLGWVNLGDGSPADGFWYGNAIGEDSGVNLDSDGTMRGLAWSENAGWVNFDTVAALSGSGQQARLDDSARRFRGYAWSENLGWINLDDETHYVALRCPADLNGDGILDNGDIGVFVALFLAGDLAADMNGDGILDNGDIGAFVAAFLAGC